MYSSLNPDAPVFHPNFVSITNRGYAILSETVRISNRFPTGQSANMCKTSADFISVTFQLREKVVEDENMIIKTELSDEEFKLDENEDNAEKIVQFNDSILEKINVNMESICNTCVTSDDECENTTSNESEQNNAPTNTKVQPVPPPDANVPRPQINFKDQVDNSHTIWVPKISDKPNSIKPLALNILYNKAGKAVGYEHPYEVELNLYHPPLTAIVPDRKPPRFPEIFENTPFTYVDTESQVDALVEHLSGVNELAVDVEHHSVRTFQGITCLIQISTFGGDFIIDALAVREHLHKLNLSFTDPRKIKVLHGAKMDVLWLQRDFGVYIVGLFDTYQAAKTLNMTDLSLKNLLKHYCQVNVDKRYQLSDWRIRPLPQEMIDYARSDTHYLLYIWHMMKNELLEAAAGQTRLLLSVFDQSRDVCAATYNKQVFDDRSYLKAYIGSKKNFNSQQMTAFKMLYKWRDTLARELDESTDYLLPNHMLTSLAESLPRGVSGLQSCCRPVPPPFVTQNLIELTQLMLTCRGLPLKPQLYPMPQSIRTMVDYQPKTKIAHDCSYRAQYSENHRMSEKQYVRCTKTEKALRTDIKTFKQLYKGDPKRIVARSTLNVDAKLFVPPYERYKKYRELAQMEEIKEFKKEEKIAAVNKDNNLIIKLMIEQKGEADDGAMEEVEKGKINEASKVKNTMEAAIAKEVEENTSSTYKNNIEHPSTSKDVNDVSKLNSNNSPSTSNNKFKTEHQQFNYKNMNYNKFNYTQKFNNSQKSSKQSKMKNKNK